MQPGYMTTQFWAAILLPIITVVLLVTRTNKSLDASTLTNMLATLIPDVIILLSSAWSVVQYIKSRTDLQLKVMDITGQPLKIINAVADHTIESVNKRTPLVAAINAPIDTVLPNWDNPAGVSSTEIGPKSDSGIRVT